MKRKTRQHDSARDVCDARYADNSTDITFVEELRKSLDETGRLDKPLMKLELMKVMRAKRIPLPQNDGAQTASDPSERRQNEE